MTQAPVLSQAEIDALMHGLGGASNSGAAGVSVAEPGAVQPFDWLGLPRLTQGALPALDVVNQRVVRELEASLRAAMAHPVDVSVHSATVRRYSDFLDETPSPTACAVVNLFPLNGQGLILCDLPLGDAWIEALYGGNVHPASKSPGAPEPRGLLGLGQISVQHLLGRVAQACTYAWRGVVAIEMDCVRAESQVRRAVIAAPLDRIHLSVFHVQIGDAGGTLSVCLPFASLSAVLEILRAPTWGDFMHPDPRWRSTLTREVPAFQVPLVAHCAPVQTSFGKLLDLEPGDFIELGNAAQLLGTPEGLPLFEGRLQSQSGRQAIRIERVLAQPDGDAVRPASLAFGGGL